MTTTAYSHCPPPRPPRTRGEGRQSGGPPEAHTGTSPSRMLTPTAHWSPWIHTPCELGSQSQAQDSTCTELHSCRLWPLSDPRYYPGESPQPIAVSMNTPSTTVLRHRPSAAPGPKRAASYWPGEASPQDTPPSLCRASDVATACQPPACPLGAFSAAGLTTVLGHHPVTARATRRPPRHPECSSPLPGAAQAQAT